MSRNGTIDCRFNFFEVEGFREKCESAGVDNLLGVVLFWHSGNYNHRSRGMFCLNVSEQLAAAESRHVNVGENCVVGFVSR